VTQLKGLKGAPEESLDRSGRPSTIIVGLDHVQLAMPPGGEEAARTFYGALLGLTEVLKPAPLAARGGCWFAGQGVHLHLGVENDFTPARKAHPAFLVTDLPGLQSRLMAAGVAVIPDDSLPGVQRFYAADPFGNRLELIEAGDRHDPLS
jgi:catechol 2,3-dioxygenase-like lactoylglutathione lyase family enzyme